MNFDFLQLNMRAVDEILPELKNVISAVNKISGLPESLEGRDKMKSWLLTLNQMAADDSISESQARQFAMDVETFYAALYAWLREKR